MADADEAEREKIYAIYHERSEKASDGDPFPDGVVDAELAFNNYLDYCAYNHIKYLNDRFPIRDHVRALFSVIKSEEPIYLDDGTKVYLMNVRTEETKKTVPYYDDHPIIDGTKIQVYSSDGPYVVFQNGDEVLFVPNLLYSICHLHLREADRIQKWSTSTAFITFSDQSFYSKEPAGFWALAKREFGLAQYASVASVAKALAYMDKMFSKNPSTELILSVIEKFEQEATEVIAEYLKRMDAVGKFQRIAQLVPEFEDIALGDSDLYIKIANRFVRTYKQWNSETEEFDGQKTIVLLENQGPLLTFYNVASGASFAVRLDELEKGRLDVYRFHDDEPNGHILLNEDGIAQGPIKDWGISSFVFYIDWAFEDLTKMYEKKYPKGR